MYMCSLSSADPAKTVISKCGVGPGRGPTRQGQEKGTGSHPNFDGHTAMSIPAYLAEPQGPGGAVLPCLQLQ